MINEETLMAYADGELADEDRSRVEAALLDNGRVQGALADEWRLRRSLLELYDPVMSEEVPERLKRLLQAPAIPFPSVSAQGSPIRRTAWQEVVAMAAALVLGIFVGHGLGADSPSPAESTERVADGKLAQALDVQLASAQSPDAPIQVGISFTGPEGQPCRSFRSPDTVGLACRADGEWALRLLAPFEGSRSSEYQQAGSATALVMTSAQELMVGEPMDAAEERRARDSGWARSEPIDSR